MAGLDQRLPGEEVAERRGFRQRSRMSPATSGSVRRRALWRTRGECAIVGASRAMGRARPNDLRDLGEEARATDLDPRWFGPAFVAFWLAITALLSVIGGWHALARRFRSDDDIDGERFRFRAAGIGWGPFPVNYGNVIFATVGRR